MNTNKNVIKRIIIMDWKLGFSYEETVKSLEKYDGVTVLEVINELKEEIRNKII